MEKCLEGGKSCGMVLLIIMTDPPFLWQKTTHIFFKRKLDRYYKITLSYVKYRKKQAGAELCQAQAQVYLPVEAEFILTNEL